MMTDAQMRQFAANSRVSARYEDLRWIVPAIEKIRYQYQGRISDATRDLGFSKGTVSRWIYCNGYPGREHVLRFRRACERLGILETRQEA